MNQSFYSLKRQLLLPLLAVATMAAVVVAAASYWLAAQQADWELQTRFASIGKVMQNSRFPLTQNVLSMLADLTSADWYSVGENGELIDSASSSLETANLLRVQPELLQQVVKLKSGKPLRMQVGKRVFQARPFANPGVRGDVAIPTSLVVVMIDDSLRQQAVYRAALVPLFTGLTTIVLLTSITYWITNRMIGRILRLQYEVQRIAQGDFSREIEASTNDELGQLSRSIASMAEQLDQMWLALRQRHGQELLHQISGGLAHNLRNTLTGARMAVELVQRQLKADSNFNSVESNAGLSIAVSQLEQAEDYVQRLLLASRGQEAIPRTAVIRECIDGLRPGLDNTAIHREVCLTWDLDPQLSMQRVSDGANLVAAISNLVWNAIEAGNNVSVSVKLLEQNDCCVDVTDDGPGPPADVGPHVFEPFVSSKPEGLGLGLALVRRSAESLSGRVEWFRQAQHTVFRFQFPINTNETSQ
jgi:signal transduction histidine kinase